jgi:outer membrane protein OmpA-like peptidoglycan-associated protein
VSLVRLNPTTRFQSPVGPMHLTKKNQPSEAIMPGLLVKVYGHGGENGELLVDRMIFRESSLRVATQISGGEVELRARQQVTANQAAANADSLSDRLERAKFVKDSVNASIAAVSSRVTDLDAYDTKDDAVVNFASGSATLSRSAKAELAELMSRNQGLTGYVVQVAGHADVTGNAAFNQRLSERRADAVVAYLTQVSAVPIRRINTPVGLGTSQPAASNKSAAGRASNRRAEVKLLVNRGVAQP